MMSVATAADGGLILLQVKYALEQTVGPQIKRWATIGRARCDGNVEAWIRDRANDRRCPAPLYRQQFEPLPMQENKRSNCRRPLFSGCWQRSYPAARDRNCSLRAGRGRAEDPRGGPGSRK